MLIAFLYVPTIICYVLHVPTIVCYVLCEPTIVWMSNVPKGHVLKGQPQGGGRNFKGGA